MAREVRRRVEIDYDPRPQFEPYHNRTERMACLVAHRRAGKTVACVNDLIVRAIKLDKPEGRFAYAGPLLSQSKDVAWTYLKRFSQPLWGREPNESELWVELVNGARIRVYGTDNPDRLRGLYLDGVVLDEYADMAPSVWGEVIRPMLTDRQGWATFIGTPKGHNAFWEMYQRSRTETGWYSAMLRASETGILPEAELEEARKDMTPEQWAQEFECSFEAAIIGAYYGKELAQAERDGRLYALDVDPHAPVHTAWDLGVGDSTAIWWWQAVPGGINVVDHYENHGQGLQHYAAVVASKGHRRGDDWVPHDAQVREFMSGGKTRIEGMIAAGLRPRLVPKHTIEDGINAARVLLPRVAFRMPECSAGVEALRQYRADYDEKTRAFKNTPRHDWTSHTADAFRYLCAAYRDMQPERPRKPDRYLMVGSLNTATLDDMWGKPRRERRRI